jgi:hypothetical protein
MYVTSGKGGKGVNSQPNGRKSGGMCPSVPSSIPSIPSIMTGGAAGTFPCIFPHI